MPTSQPTDDAVVTLAKYGLDPETIASVVKSPLAEIHATLTTQKSRIAKPDEELAGEAKAFVRLALKRATLLMQFGLPSQQIALIRSVLPAAMRALGAENNDDGRGTYEELQVLFHEIRNVPAATKTIGEPIDVESAPASQTANDQNQVFGDSPV